MMKQVTVNIVVDDHEPEKCSLQCKFYYQGWCGLCNDSISNTLRCKQCLEEDK